MKTPLVREKLTLRVPPDVHRRLQRAAVNNGRSLNAEIVQRLRMSLEGMSAAEASRQK
jgi:predicted HicB family RNase H-like nuclease